MQSLLWVFVFGIMFFSIYISFKRSLPATIFLFLILMMNYYYDMLPGYALDFIYIFVILTILGIIAKLLNFES